MYVFLNYGFLSQKIRPETQVIKKVSYIFF